MSALIRLRNCGACGHMAREGQTMHCHHNPPSVTPILVPSQHGPQVIGYVTAFPVVSDQMFCGQWKARIVGLADEPSAVQAAQ